jgi:hypothetical protein
MQDDGDTLYGLPLEEFVARRDALAAERRRAGDRDAARALKALPKPTRAAWAVNRLVRDHPEEVRALIAAGKALEGAQEALLGGADAEVLRQAADAARAVVDALGDRVDGSDAVRDKVRATLHAAIVDADVRDEVAAGRVIRERAAAGFGGLDGLPAPPVAAEGAAPRRAAAAPPGVAPRTKAAKPAARKATAPEAATRRDLAMVRRAREAEAKAQADADGARRALEQVEATAVGRRRELMAAEAALEDARARREKAERAAG